MTNKKGVMSPILLLLVVVGIIYLVVHNQVIPTGSGIDIQQTSTGAITALACVFNTVPTTRDAAGSQNATMHQIDRIYKLTLSDNFKYSLSERRCKYG